MKTVLNISLAQTKKSKSSWGDGVSLDDLSLEDMTFKIREERKEEKVDEERQKKLERQMTNIKEEIIWSEKKLLEDIKSAKEPRKNADGTVDTEASKKIQLGIDSMKDRIKDFKKKYNAVHIQALGKPFYAVSSARVVVSKSLKKNG